MKKDFTNGRVVLKNPFIAIYFIMLGTCFYFLFGTGGDTDGLTRPSDDALYQALWLLLYVILLTKVFLRPGSVSIGLSPLIFLSLVGLISLIRNDFDPDETLRLTMLAMTILFSTWAASFYTFDEFFDIFYRVACFVAVVHMLIYPEFVHLTKYFDTLGRLNLFGSSVYAGLFAHKNQAGIFFALAFIIGTFKLTSAPRYTFLSVGFLFLIFVCLVLAGAASPLFSSVLAVLGIFVLKLARRIEGSRFIVLSGVAIFVGALFLWADVFLALVGRDLTFSGRSFLYASWYEYFSLQPLIGYGYGQFFSESEWAQGAILNSQKLNAHYINFESGYLQAGIDFGIIGIIALAYIFISVFKYLIKKSRIDGSLYAPLGIVFFIFTSSFVEVYITLYNSLYPAILFFIYVRIQRERNQSAIYLV